MSRLIGALAIALAIALSVPTAPTSGVLPGAAVVTAQTPDERAAARGLVAKYGPAVVNVLGTVKIRITQGGREMQNSDQRLRTMATVLDASGLTVTALSTMDPGELLAAQLGRGRPPTAPALGVTTDPSELRYRLPDGSEVPARVVLRDKELDLAFLRPVEPLTTPMAFVGAPSARANQLDLLFIVNRTFDATNWQAAGIFSTVVVVMDKPRAFYSMTGGAFGAPVFDLQGRFVGVGVRLRSEDEQAATAAPPILLPADDIREVAKQAK